MINKFDAFSETGYLNDIFQMIRIVDPIKKIVIEENGKIPNNKHKCFEMCKRKDICENCISIRAYNENRSVIKIEYIEDKLYMIIASPVNKGNSHYIIETVRDITESKILDAFEYKTTDVLHNKFREMNKLIVTDDLTECYNRRYINEKLPVDIDIAQRENRELSIAMVDIDYFKGINDKYGHLVGDVVLKNICSIIKNNIREQGDWIARYGGEEFLILFNDTPQDMAYNLSERIKLIIEKSITKYDDIEIKITVSIGVATISNKINSIDKLIEKADENLYKAKESGRNLVVR